MPEFLMRQPLVNKITAAEMLVVRISAALLFSESSSLFLFLFLNLIQLLVDG